MFSHSAFLSFIKSVCMGLMCLVFKGDSCGVCQGTTAEVGSGPSMIKVTGERGPPGPPGPPGEGVEGKQVSLTILLSLYLRGGKGGVLLLVYQCINFLFEKPNTH